MKKLITTFVTGCLLLWTSIIFAQPTFTFSPADTSANPGDQLTFEVSVTDFTDILSFQYSMNWDPNVLDFVSVDNITTDLASFAASSFGTTQANDGKLSVNWFDPNVSGVSLTNGTILYSLTFDVLSTDGTDLAFTGDPTVIEVVDSNGDDIGMIAQNAAVNGGAPGGGGGGGGGNSSDLILTASQVNAANGDQICLDVSVENFNNILSMQYSMNFNENVIEYVNVTNLNLQDLAPSNFGTTMTDQGILTLSWFDNTNATGVTVPNGTVIFQVCFDVIGSMGQNSSFDFTSTPTVIEVFDGSSNVVPVSTNSGSVNVTSGGGNPPNPNGLIVSAPSVTGNQGTNICLDVSVENFDNILSMQFSMNFDETVLQYTGVDNLNLQDLAPSNFGTTMTDQGVLTLSWFDNTNASGVTVGDGTVIFQVCFDIIGSNGENSPFDFTSNPTVIEVFDGDSNPVDFTGNNGSVTVGDGGNPPPPPSNDGLINASDHYPMEDEEFCMDIYVSDFLDILSMQFSMNFDPNELEFQEVVLTGNLPDLLASAINTNNANMGEISLAWFDQTTEGVTLDDGTVIFQLCFKVLGACGTVTNMDFTDSPVPIEIIDAAENEVPFTSNPGIVDICGSPPLPSVTVSASDYQADQDEEFCIDIDVSNFENIASMAYSMSFDPSKVEFQSIQLTNNLTGLDIADFDTGSTANGTLTLNWQEASGVTVADGTTIYQVCFKSLAACGTASSNFEFTDSPVAIALTDGDGNAVDLTGNSGEISSCVIVNPPPTPANEFIVASDHTPMEGEDFCMDISVNDFDNIVSMQYSMTFDPNELEFQSIEVPGNLNGLATSNFGVNEVGNGIITVSWLDPDVSGITLADGTVIYQVCFKVLGACGTLTNFEFTDSPTVIEVTDGNGNLVNFDSNPGVVDICGDGTPPPPPPPATGFMVASDHQPQEGEDFCMDISVNDFDNIVSMQYSMTFDPNELEFQSIQVPGNLNGLAVSNFGVNDTGNGIITVSWLDPDVAGITLADGTVIFQVCFKTLGACGTVTNFEFTDSPTVIEVTDGDGNLVDFTSDPGIVDICGTPATPFILTAAQDDVPQGETLCIPITAQGFEDIVSMQYTMTFDPNIFQYTGTQNYGLNGLSSSNFGVNNASNGVITFSWIDPDAVGITMPDGSILYEICFEAIGNVGDVSQITFTDSPTAIEIGKANGTITPTLNNGSGTIIDGCPGPLTYDAAQTVTQNVGCNGGADGLIDITVGGGDGNYSFEWRNSSGTVVSTDPDYVGGAGTFTVSVTSCSDNVSFSETFTITEPDPIDVTINVTDVDCFGQSTGFIVTDPSGGTTPYNYNWNPGNNISLFNLTAGTYAFTITDGNGCLYTSEPIDVVEPVELTATATAVDPPCFGDNGTINVSANGGSPSYEYSNDNGTTWQPASTFSNVPEGNYTVLVRDDRGCVETIAPDVVVDAPEELNITLNSTFDSGNCIGSAAVQVSGGNAITDYFWSGPNATYFNAPNQSGLCAGQHCVIVQDINGCQTSECVYVSRPLIVTGTVGNACWGINNGEINVLAQGGVPPNPTYTYSWDPQVPNPGSPNQIGLSPGTYCVTVTSMPDNQMETMCFNVAQAAEPVQIGNADLNDPTGPNLFNGSIQVSGVTGGFGGPYTYKWDPNLGSGPVLDNLDEGTYNLTVCDVNGCNISASYVLEIVPTDLQFATFDFQDSDCSDSDNGSFTFSITGGLPTYNVTVSGLSGTVYSNPSLTENQVVTIDDLPPGDYSIHAEYNVAGYTGDIDANFTIEAPAPIVLASLKIQNRTEDELGRIFIDIDGGDGSYTYQWSNGKTSQDIFDLQAAPYSVTVTDGVGCTSEFGPFEVEFFEVDGAVTDDVDCPNDETGSITPNIVGVAGDPVCEWVGPNGEIFTTCNISNLPAGIYTLVVTDSCGVETPEYEFEIKANSDISVTVNPSTNYNGVNISCKGESDGGAIAIVTGGLAPIDFFWNNGETTEEITNVPAGIYSVTVIDALGCEDTDATTLTEPDEELMATVTAQVSPSCAGAQNGSATVTVSGGTPFPGANPYIYQWNDAQSQSGPTAILLKAGDYECTVTDRNGCQVIVPISISDPDKMEVTISTTCDNGDADGTALANVFGGTGPYEFTWSNGDTAQFISNLVAGTYFVEVIDNNGCQATDITGGFVCPNFGCFEARTVITPEGDGRNEEFIIGCTSRFTNNTLEIFNRWGQLVFETDDYVCEEASLDGCWKGTNARGEDLPEGVYFYIFDYTDPVTNEEDQKRGSVTILRQ